MESFEKSREFNASEKVQFNIFFKYVKIVHRRTIHRDEKTTHNYYFYYIKTLLLNRGGKRSCPP